MLGWIGGWYWELRRSFLSWGLSMKCVALGGVHVSQACRFRLFRFQKAMKWLRCFDWIPHLLVFLNCVLTQMFWAYWFNALIKKINLQMFPVRNIYQCSQTKSYVVKKKSVDPFLPVFELLLLLRWIKSLLILHQTASTNLLLFYFNPNYTCFHQCACAFATLEFSNLWQRNIFQYTRYVHVSYCFFLKCSLLTYKLRSSHDVICGT